MENEQPREKNKKSLDLSRIGLIDFLKSSKR